MHSHREHVVATLRALGVFFGQLSINWETDAYRVDGSRLSGSVVERADCLLAAVEGEQRLEWLPKAGVTDL
ncbi:hypothetical protein PR003_g609 [Phytophthora rubi]|uniref:Uncharacterized protein n=1 Tax=Phytophthora rubi TaxID=129364 RepID=A0A6A3PBU0_9STRA|nr:hypothetical protein PR001_g1792 [Phytophthora rubi]KAE9359633.1 hypothetical protein PR003_g609 [Phytophthora rubi]